MRHAQARSEGRFEGFLFLVLGAVLVSATLGTGFVALRFARSGARAESGAQAGAAVGTGACDAADQAPRLAEGAPVVPAPVKAATAGDAAAASSGPAPVQADEGRGRDVPEAAPGSHGRRVPSPGRDRKLDPERPVRVAGFPIDFLPLEAWSPAEPRARVVVRLDRIPSARTRRRLADAGLLLGEPAAKGAYVARLDPAGRNDAVLREVVSGMAEYGPAPKTSPALRTGDVGEWARAGAELLARVDFYPEVELDEALGVIRSAGASPESDAFEYPRELPVRVRAADVPALASAWQVRRLREAPPPPVARNLAAARIVDVPRVQPEAIGTVGASFDGTGITVGVWDAGSVDGGHQDLEGRVDRRDGTAVHYHSTMVAGTVAGIGRGRAAAEGMAPGARIVSRDWNRVERELAAEAARGVLISNHSWGWDLGWHWSNGSWYWRGGTDQWGAYVSESADWDRLASAHGLLLVTSAGNDANDTGPGGPKDRPNDGTRVDGHYYDLLSGTACAKNTLVVGSLPKVQDPLGMSAFSNAGPTDDGRIKPELVAPGEALWTTYPGDRYSAGSGTSFSSPVVAGVAALLAQAWQARFGREARGDELKALLIHTATDLGLAGPDARSGFGRVNAGAALALVTGDAAASRILVGGIDQGDESGWSVDCDGTEAELRLTLLWFDPPALAWADPALVNDLDLRIESPDGATRFPFRLSAGRPAAAAVDGAPNRTDNVEQVLVPAPVRGRWKVTVEGYGVNEGPQRFVLVSSRSLRMRRAVVRKFKAAVTGDTASFVWETDAHAVSIDFGDGARAEDLPASGSITHAYARHGAYRPALVAEGPGRTTAYTTVKVQPRIDAFAASPSTVARLDPVVFSWHANGPVDLDFGDGKVLKDLPAAGTRKHAYDRAGAFQPVLKTGSATRAASVKVIPRHLEIHGYTLVPYWNTSVVYVAAAVQGVDGKVRWTISIEGAGTARLRACASIIFGCRFKAPGWKTMTLQIRTPEGDEGEATVRVLVGKVGVGAF